MGLLNDFKRGIMGSSGSPKPSSSLRNDPNRFSSDFRYKVEKDLRGTLKDTSTRSVVADIFYQSRGGSGVTNQEIKDGLNKALRQGRLTENQVWAVRKKYLN